MKTVNINCHTQNAVNTQNDSGLYTTMSLTTQSVLNDNNNISTTDIVTYVFMSGILVTILFITVKCCIRILFGIIPLRNTHNVNDHPNNMMTETQALHTEPQEERD